MLPAIPLLRLRFSYGALGRLRPALGEPGAQSTAGCSFTPRYRARSKVPTWSSSGLKGITVEVRFEL